MLLVTLDTTRADHLGCYGASFAATPNLDALARSGMRFDRALSPTPLTFPSHVTVLTGRTPRRHGVRDNALYRLDPDMPVLAETLKAAGYRTAAFVSAAVLDRGVGLGRGFDLYDDRLRVGDPKTASYEDRPASQTTKAVLARLRDLKPPFFLWVHYYDPHLPYAPPEPFRTRFRRRPYDGEIAFMDSELGRLLTAVKSKAVHLLIVAAGDHGESLGEHGEGTHGVFVYQSTQHVPLILAGPGIPGGKVEIQNVGLVDITPTILDLVGLPPLPGVEGRSLGPFLRGDRGGERDYEMESFFPRFSYGWAPLRALVRGDLKYIEAPRPELYQIRSDPREQNDQSASLRDEAQGLGNALARLTEGDEPRPSSADPELSEQAHRMRSLGYVGGSGFTREDPVIDPKDGIAWIADLVEARQALKLGNASAGIPRLERLLARNPTNVPALMTLAACQVKVGHVDQAIALNRRTLSYYPASDLAHYNLATSLSEKARTDPEARIEAREEYERALALNPRHVDSYLAYADMLSEQKELDASRVVLERARREGLQDPEIETRCGWMELARGAVGPARAAFLRALSQNPRAGRALEGLGHLAYSAADYRRAANYYARALEDAPSTRVAKTLGSIRLQRLGDRAGARQAYRRGLELAPPGSREASEILDLLKKLETSR